jgi:hypothetical protein
MMHSICVQDLDAHPLSSHLLQIPNGLRSLRQFARLLLQPRADIIARVFKLKLDELMHDLCIHTIWGDLLEFPRSLNIRSACSLLTTLWSLFILMTGARQQRLVPAKIPRETNDADNEETRDNLIWARTIVLTHMAHGPCGAENPSECLAKSVDGAA